MIYIDITGWVDPPAPMNASPASAAATALHDQGLGETSQLEALLERPPARVGPFEQFREAQSISRLLQGFGALAMVVEDQNP